MAERAFHRYECVGEVLVVQCKVVNGGVITDRRAEKRLAISYDDVGSKKPIAMDFASSPAPIP